MLDSNLLLGKLHYAMGMYEDSLNYYSQAELQTLTEKQLPSRSLRIVAESYAIKGKWKCRYLDWIDSFIHSEVVQQPTAEVRDRLCMVNWKVLVIILAFSWCKW
jgi:hypothetical protein